VNDKQVLITGATNGIGLAAAEGLAALGANVAIVGRSKAKTRIASARITAAAGRGPTVATFIADLSSQAAVRRLAAEVLDRYPKLDVLVNNAGAMYATRQLTTQRLVCGGGFVYVIHKGALVDVILGAEYQHFDLNAACGSASIRLALRRPSATLT
jgi:NAD(P)-dependent dehydrogenase (short-subunit alcohol dehydrogenase family)